MTDPLEKIVAEGRSKRERELAEASIQDQERERDMGRDTQRRLWASVSPYARWTWALYAGAVVVVLAVAMRGVVADADASSGFAVLAAVPVFLVAWWLRGTLGRRALARNESKLRGSSFPVSGYVAALSSTTTEGKATLVIRFAESGKTITPNAHASFREPAATIEKTVPPSDTILADAFSAIDAELAEPRKDGARVVEWEASGGDSSYLTNAHLEAWIWRAIHVLEAIHPRFPIQSVEIHGFR